MIAMRGAITVAKNSREEILEATKRLLKKIIEENCLCLEQIISILFTATSDLDAVYPAVAARELGITKAGLSCMQEMAVVNSLQRCIRVLVLAETEGIQNDVKHVYLEKARVLRPDIAGEEAVQKEQNAIAIDGPAGSGKSTVAKLLAKRLGLVYIDTGAMYRTIGLYCKRKNVNLEDSGKLADVLQNMHMDIQVRDEKQCILLNGEDVGGAIRTSEAGEWASKVAKLLPVREYLVNIQRKLAEKMPVIMDGRDIGTHVLPHASVKIYLNASVQERAKRRLRDLQALGEAATLQEVEEKIRQRDYQDMHRELNPLKKAADAVEIDTTGYSIEEVAAEIADIIQKRKG